MLYRLINKKIWVIDKFRNIVKHGALYGEIAYKIFNAESTENTEDLLFIKTIELFTDV
jgi:hypothetical protein